MHHPIRRSRLVAVRSLAAAGLLALSGSIAGCGEDQAQRAIDEASRELSSINAGANGRQWSADKVLERVKQSMSSLPGSASDAQKASASLLVAQAERGLGEFDAAQAIARMSEASLAIGPAEAHLRAFARHSARGSDAAAFDAAPYLADLSSREGEVRVEMQAVDARISELRGQASTLRERVTSLRAESDAARLRAADLQTEADQQDAVAAVATARSAHEARRLADTIAIEALGIEQEAAAVDQQIAELAILREKSEAQLEALALAGEGVRERQARLTVEAGEAAAAAEQAAQAFRDAIAGEGGLDAQHARLIPESFDAAIAHYQAAQRSAQQARSADRGSASLASALAQHAMANLHVARSEGQLAYASLLEQAAGASLPGGGAYAERAAQARQRASEHAQSAAEAYEAAVSGYEGSGARGEAAEIRDQLAERLTQLQALSLDQQAAPESYAPAASGEGDEPQASRGAGGSGEIPADLRALIERTKQAVADGDVETLLGLTRPAGDAERGLLEPMRGMVSASGELDRATQAAFGEPFSDWAEANPEALGPLGASMSQMNSVDPALATLDVDAMNLSVDGDRATGTLPDGTPARYTRIDGEWFVLLSAEDLGMPPQMISMVQRMLGPLADLNRQLAGRVESGELQSNQAVAVAMMGGAGPIMQQMMGGGGN